MENRVVKPFTIWRHFKGFKAMVINVIYSETKEKLVIYRCIDNNGKTNHSNGISARLLEVFLS